MMDIAPKPRHSHGKTRHSSVDRHNYFRENVLDDISTKADASILPHKAKAEPLKVSPFLCPCCQQAVSIPTPQLAAEHYGLSPMQTKVLAAVWKGNGFPVPTKEIWDAMYADDIDGGPSMRQMYVALKDCLNRIHKRLKGSGFDIASAGYGAGYRIVITSTEAKE